MSTITQFPSGNTQYRIEFDYLARTFVVVTLVNSSNPALNRVLEVGRDYRFLNPTMIEMLVDQSGFDIVRIHRQTGTDLVVDFRNGSVLTASDLTNAELQSIHIAEEGRDQTVDLAKEYADAAGSSAGNAKDSEDEARRIAERIKAAGLLGYITRRSFEKGFNVITWNEVLLWEEDGDYYRWDGTLPKNVPAGSTPETAGGVGLGAWVSVGDASIRTELSGENGDELIGVKQPFTDSAKRTQHDKNKEIVSVLDFYLGIDPDYTNAFNRALAASNEVFVPAGDFTVSGSINIKSFQTLRGTGYGSQIKTSSGMTDPVISIHGSGYPTGAVSYATVMDLVISNDYGKTMNGLEIINASSINVQRVFVNNCKNGADLDSVELVDFNNCYFSGGGEFGIRAISSRSGLVNSWISVTDCMVNGNVLGGCLFVDSASTVLTNVKVINNQDYGVRLQLKIPSQRMWVSINNCDIDSNWNTGVYLEGISGGVLEGTIHGSWISGGRTSSQGATNPAGHGLFCNLVTDLKVVSTRFFANGNHGVHLVNSTGVTLSACSLQGNDGAAIYGEGSSLARITVTGCSIDPSGSAFTQSEAVQLATGNYHSVIGNTITPHTVTNVIANGAQSKVFGNTGFTEDTTINSTGSTGVLQNKVEVLNINSGATRPGTDNTTSLGIASHRWSVVYAANGTVQTSDERLKSFEDILECEKKAAEELKNHIRKFRWNTEQNGAIHFGVSAQKVREILDSNGCTGEYSFVTYDKDADLWGVNYPELLAFLLIS